MSAALKLKPGWVEVDESGEHLVHVYCWHCRKPVQSLYRAYLSLKPDALSEAISAHARCKA